MAGETTTRTGASPFTVPRTSVGPQLNAVTYTASYATGELENTDIKVIGYVPAGATVVGFKVSATDMDTNGAPTLAMKLTLGSTDLVTGIQEGRAGTSACYACVPTTVTSDTVLKVINTGAAATAASGTLYVTVEFYL